MLNNDMLCEKHEFDAPTVPKIEYGKLLHSMRICRVAVQAVRLHCRISVVHFVALIASRSYLKPLH